VHPKFFDSFSASLLTAVLPRLSPGLPIMRNPRMPLSQ
jgi:hypothetical protein